MPNELMLACLNHAGGFGIGAERAYVYDQREARVSGWIVRHEPEMIFAVNLAAAKKCIALFHPSGIQITAGQRADSGKKMFLPTLVEWKSNRGQGTIHEIICRRFPLNGSNFVLFFSARP
jgi:hypothetical protein